MEAKMNPKDSGKLSKKDFEVYNHSFLSIYDYFVLNFICPLVWRCSKSKILSLYNENISSNHLDIGVGTGYFLDNCTFPNKNPHISLLDLNKPCLAYTNKRIQRYNPDSYVTNIFNELPFNNKKFESIGLNYLLHCLPGNIYTKAKVFENILPVLAPEGTIFGATVLGKNININWVAKNLIKIYNRYGIFCNSGDDLAGLKAILNKYFRKIEIKMSGCIALFTAKL